MNPEKDLLKQKEQIEKQLQVYECERQEKAHLSDLKRWTPIKKTDFTNNLAKDLLDVVTGDENFLLGNDCEILLAVYEDAIRAGFLTEKDLDEYTKIIRLTVLT